MRLLLITLLIITLLLITVTPCTAYKLCSNNVCQVGGSGKVLTISNNAHAKNPTYSQLITFLRKDRTDEKRYTSNYVCSDFARTLHNNAERSGIKMGWVASNSCNHAFNIVKTRDKGFVYIDCTGTRKGGRYQDKILSVKNGKPLTGKYIFKKGKVTYGCKVKVSKVFW